MAAAAAAAETIEPSNEGFLHFDCPSTVVLICGAPARQAAQSTTARCRDFGYSTLPPITILSLRQAGRNMEIETAAE